MSASELFYYRPEAIVSRDETLDVDICVYGGTAAGVIAALTAARQGKTSVILEQSAHLGGLTTGGLACTDFGRKQVIGGFSHEFYKRVGAKYGQNEEWNFEPSVAEVVIKEMAAESGAKIYFRQYLQDVEKDGTRITAITLEGGLKVRAKVFIDATYEGDLLARAGCSYHVGRESNARYGETLNGRQVHKTHQFDLPVDPYVEEGNPASGLLPFVEPEEAAIGEGDKRVQAYNFRLCLTKVPENRIPYEKPAGYDRQQYELLARYFRAGFPRQEVFRKFDPLKGNKVDKNNHAAVSTDFIGANWEYPEADYARREEIFQAHVTYQKGLMWFLAHDESVPADIRAEWNEWGLCKDEFQDCGGWSQSLYIREGRRLVSDYVVTELDCRAQRACDDPVGMGSYNMDSHNCTRFVTADGKVKNDGDVQIGVTPYPVSYRSIRPKANECTNLLVPVACSTSHIAFGSLRMEPVFMVLGQSAATAAGLAIDLGKAVQEVPYDKLRAQLDKDGQVLSWAG